MDHDCPCPASLCGRDRVVRNFLNYLTYRGAWQLGELSADYIMSVYQKLKAAGGDRRAVDGFAEVNKFVLSLTPNETADFQQMWLIEDKDIRQDALGLHVQGGKRASAGSDGGIAGKTNGIAFVRHMLSDLWRTFGARAKWTWTDAEKTVGFGNATLSEESVLLVTKVKRYA